MKKQFIIFYVAAFCIVAGLSFATPAFSAILFYEDFEDALVLDQPRDWYYTHSPGRGGSYELTTEQARAGLGSCKFSLTRYTSDDYRSELVLRNAFNDGSLHFTIGDEYWIGFSIFLADGYNSPADSGGWMIHHQYHSTEDEPPTCDWKEGIRNPILVIRTLYGSNNWSSRIQWDDQQCTPLQKVGVSMTEYEYDAFSTGQWCDFVINVKWSYNNDGFLKIWKNGVLKTDRIGGTCFNDTQGPFLQMGIYGNPGQNQTATIYYDELRIGDSRSSYSEVAPGGSVKSLPPTSVKPLPPTNVEAK